MSDADTAMEEHGGGRLETREDLTETGFPGVQLVRIRLPCGTPGFDPWVGRSPGEEKGYPLQDLGLENSMDYVVHGVAKSWRRLSDSLHTET